MPLTVAVAPAVAANTPFRFTVPGQQRWTIRTVYAVCATQVGGQPNRSYSLTLSDGTHTVAVAAAADAGTEPATVNVTWANVPSADVTAGTTGIVVAAFPAVVLPPGFTITGTIVAGVATDQWTLAVCWYDFANAV